jgi:8-oxo-dGTP diphosphatase
MNAGPVHVVAGILRDEQGRTLLAQRPQGKHLAGLWEFPGGKCEPEEPPEDALRRELHEEIGVEIGEVERLIAVPWRYPQKSILLDVYSVLSYTGPIHGREGQALRWTTLDEIQHIDMPPADRPIVAALRLPRHYVITPEPGADDAQFLRALQRMLEAGEKCIQLRSKQLAPARLRALAMAARGLTKAAGADLLINSHLELAQELGIGVHFSAEELMRLSERPLAQDSWIAASCHDAHELAHAAAIGVDFVVLGPVQRTASHPRAEAIGWARFAELCVQVPLPVYALGGMAAGDFAAARSAGGQGVAGISGFWPDRGES